MNDLTAKQFGFLTVIRRNGVTGKNNHIAWECLCVCGNKKTFDSGRFSTGRLVSCGCIRRNTGRTVLLGDGTFQKIQQPKNLPEIKSVLELRSRDENRGYKTECRVWIGSKNGGYGNMRIVGGVERTHRLMWKCHHGDIPESLEVCHRCDQPDCLRIDHLFLGTHKQNMLDAQEKERMGGPVGEAHYSCKLTAAKVLELRKSFESGLRPSVELAASLGVSYAAVMKIKNRQSWKSI